MGVSFVGRFNHNSERNGDVESGFQILDRTKANGEKNDVNLGRGCYMNSHFIVSKRVITGILIVHKPT